MLFLDMTPNKFLKNRSGIYGIRNIVTNKIYVGKSECMYRRCGQYLYDIRVKRIGHLNDYLYNSIVKYGIEEFEMFPLEFCEPNMLSEREFYWIEKLESTNRIYGYNFRLDSESGMITSRETSNKISNNLKRQWAEGLRKQHSEKMIESWKDKQRLTNQSLLLSKILTKYDYVVVFPNGESEICSFKRLKELGLQTSISSFHRNKSNFCTCRNHQITRRLLP